MALSGTFGFRAGISICFLPQNIEIHCGAGRLAGVFNGDSEKVCTTSALLGPEKNSGLIRDFS
jgi:hypothetical protein